MRRVSRGFAARFIGWEGLKSNESASPPPPPQLAAGPHRRRAAKGVDRTRGEGFECLAEEAEGLVEVGEEDHIRLCRIAKNAWGKRQDRVRDPPKPLTMSAAHQQQQQQRPGVDHRTWL